MGLGLNLTTEQLTILLSRSYSLMSFDEDRTRSLSILKSELRRTQASTTLTTTICYAWGCLTLLPEQSFLVAVHFPTETFELHSGKYWPTRSLLPIMGSSIWRGYTQPLAY